MTRRISWDAALRDLRDDRRKVAPIREQRLRTTAGLRGSPAVALSAWRGRSGKRYVVGVHALPGPAPAGDDDDVGLIVSRDAEGIAAIVTLGRLGLVRRMGFHGYDLELHVHRLADGEAERAAVLADLVDTGRAPLPPMQHQAARPVTYSSVS